MAGSMNEDPLRLSDREAALIRSMRADPELQSTILKLSSIGRDEEPSCYSADQAEESIHLLGERLKRASMQGWAQSANDKEMDKARAQGCRRSKKKS